MHVRKATEDEHRASFGKRMLGTKINKRKWDFTHVEPYSLIEAEPGDDCRSIEAALLKHVRLLGLGVVRLSAGKWIVRTRREGRG